MYQYLSHIMFSFSRITQASAGPSLISVRYDSLLVQCLIAAGIYFGPQDAALGFLAAVNGRAYSNSYNKPVEVSDPQGAIEKFYAKKGLSEADLDVRRGRSWEVAFAKMYK
jgi:hypothetical protein